MYWGLLPSPDDRKDQVQHHRVPKKKKSGRRWMKSYSHSSKGSKYLALGSTIVPAVEEKRECIIIIIFK